jgi:hypothetical protein
MLCSNQGIFISIVIPMDENNYIHYHMKKLRLEDYTLCLKSDNVLELLYTPESS